MTQGFVRHHRTEIGAADADVDDVANGPTRVAAPVAAADLFREGRHAVEDRVHLGHDVDAVDQNPLVCRRPQGDVEHRALLGHVDLGAAEHGVDALGEAAFVGQPQQQSDRLVGHPVLRVVEVETGGFRRQALAPPHVVGEELAQMQIAHLLVMRRQRLPRRALGQRLDLSSSVRDHGCPAPV